MDYQTIAAAAAALRSGDATAVGLVEASLRAIEQHNALTNAFIRVDTDAARTAARAADKERASGIDRGPLHGMPISLKDLIDVAGQPTTAASAVLKDHVAREDAPITARLRRAGAVLIGKTNLHEFALGTTSEESAFGAVRHPQDAARSPGGSSGGSAVAVATGMGLASIGTDTGGSIRIPAAACGVVGLKPTFGEVPTDGVVPLSWSLDHAGPLARSVQDAAWLWAALTERPASTVVPRPAGSLRLAQLTGYFAVLSADVRAPFEAALDQLRARGTSVIDQTLVHAETIASAYVNIVLPEAAVCHARYLDARAGDYTPLVRGRIETGRTISAVDYLTAKRTCGELRHEVDTILSGCDALVLPTLPIVAPLIGTTEVTMDSVSGNRVPVRSAMLRLTQLFDMTGHPAISLPLRTGGLPVGLQLVGQRDETAKLLEIAAAVEQVLDQA
jgi:aspartyl-tRNA(Asn)/glutamyl-tRNA(Gln) amidotransferase subunit A